MLDVIGHVSYVLISLGLFMLAKNKRQGWCPKLVGDSLFVYIGAQLAMTSIMFWGSVFVLMDIIGIVKWRKDANKDAER